MSFEDRVCAGCVPWLVVADRGLGRHTRLRVDQSVHQDCGEFRAPVLVASAQTVLWGCGNSPQKSSRLRAKFVGLVVFHSHPKLQPVHFRNAQCWADWVDQDHRNCFRGDEPAPPNPPQPHSELARRLEDLSYPCPFVPQAAGLARGAQIARAPSVDTPCIHLREQGWDGLGETRATPCCWSASLHASSRAEVAGRGLQLPS